MVKWYIGNDQVTPEEFDAHAEKQHQIREDYYKKFGRPTRVCAAVLDHLAPHVERYRKWYKEKGLPPVIEDYRSKEAAKSWPGYKRVQVGDTWKEGPEPFKTRKEELLYQKLYGFHEETGTKTDKARSLAEDKKRKSK